MVIENSIYKSEGCEKEERQAFNAAHKPVSGT